MAGVSTLGSSEHKQALGGDRGSVLTPDQVADILRIKPATVLVWARDKKIPGFKVGRNWLFFESDLLEYLAQEAERQGALG